MTMGPAVPESMLRSAWLTAFVLVNALAAVLITLGNVTFSETAWDWRPALFLLTALPAHLVLFGGLACLPAWWLGRLTDRRWMVASAIALQLLWICLLLADARTFALYRFHLNAMVVNMLFGGALGQQVLFSPEMWTAIALCVAFVVVAEVALARLLWRALARHPGVVRVRHAWWAAALLMALGLGMFGYYEARGERAVTSQLAYIPWAQPVTFKTRLRRLGMYTSDAAGLPGVADGVLDYPRAPVRCDRPPALNVLVVVVESLRPDAVNPRTMPNTWRLARQAQWFQNHYSTGNATRFGLFGLMYGLPGGYWHGMLAERRGPVMVDRMVRTGYRMHIYGSAPLYSPEFDRTVFTQVRDRITNAPRDLPLDARDRHIVDRLQGDIRAHPRDRRFFGFAFLDAPHAPYHVPRDFVSPFQPMSDTMNFLELGPDHDPLPEHNRYRAAVHYDDQLIGELLAALADGQLADNTVVLITGDHGEEFNELRQNYWTHNGNFSDFQLRTAFVLYWPGRAPQRQAKVSSHEDFAPTLMRHALGCSSDIADYSTGQDLFDATSPAARPLLAESWSQRAIRDGEKTYLFDGFGRTSVLDRRYRVIPDAQADPNAVRRSWEMLTRFQKRQ